MPTRPSVPKKAPKYAVPAVDNMLDIVEFLAGQTRPFGVTELSRTLHITTNSAFRILRRLVERGYAEIESQSGQTAQLQIPDGDRLLILDVANASSPFYIQTQPGSRVFYHANAFGKCLLAFQDEARRRNNLPRPWPRLTENTLMDWPQIEAELETVRQTGLGYDREEYLRGVSCIGAPVFDVSSQAVAGVGITFLVGEGAKQRPSSWQRTVLETAAKIAQDIGYCGDFYTQKLTDLS